MIVTRKAARRHLIAAAYRGTFYALASSPIWGAAAVAVIVYHRARIA
jgi:hypothetical protein